MSETAPVLTADHNSSAARTATPPDFPDPSLNVRSCSSGSETCTSDRDLMTVSSEKSAQYASAAAPLGSISPPLHPSSTPTLPSSPARSVLPSKLALKRNGDMSSPRKSVVIDNNTPEVHHYEHQDSTADISSHDSQSDVSYSPPDHKWNPIASPPRLATSQSLAHSLPAPALPRHSVLSFESLLNSHSSKNRHLRDSLDDEHYERSPAKKILTGSVYDGGDHSVSQLDMHLQDLHRESLNHTNSNIRSLTSTLNTTSPQVDHPLLSLSDATYLERHSSCLSDSSRQSLREQDRSLTSSPVRSQFVQGVELKDGFRGLSDASVNALILPPMRPDFDLVNRSEPETTFRNAEESILKMLGPSVLLSLPDLSSSMKYEHPLFVKHETSYNDPLVFLNPSGNTVPREAFVKQEFDHEPHFFLALSQTAELYHALVKNESEMLVLSSQYCPDPQAPIKEEFEPPSFEFQIQKDLGDAVPAPTRVDEPQSLGLGFDSNSPVSLKQKDVSHHDHNAEMKFQREISGPVKPVTPDDHVEGDTAALDVRFTESDQPSAPSLNPTLHSEGRLMLESGSDQSLMSSFKFVASDSLSASGRFGSRLSMDQCSELSDEDDNYSRGQPTIDLKGPLKSSSNLLINNAKMLVTESVSETGAPKMVKGPNFAEETNSFDLLIRFHTDSAWKLENSNDGDREDNDDPRDDDDVTGVDILPALSDSKPIKRGTGEDSKIRLAPVKSVTKSESAPSNEAGEVRTEEGNLSVYAKTSLEEKAESNPFLEQTHEHAEDKCAPVPAAISSELRNLIESVTVPIESKDLPVCANGNTAWETQSEYAAEPIEIKQASRITIAHASSDNVNQSMVGEVSILDPGSPTKKSQFSMKAAAAEQALANSSNIEQESEDFTLPVIVPEEFLPLEEISRHPAPKSLEESLSAEHDPVPSRPLDYKQIWRLQARKEKSTAPARKKQYILSPPKLKPIDAPFTLQPKSFREVSVKSRRILSPTMEDLQVTNFLPDLSEDSCFESHFDFMRRSNLSMYGVSNVLSGLDEKPLSTTRLSSRRSSLKHRMPTRPRKSRFEVPSFEIRRSNSRLSPRDTYNDIFESSFDLPTIKSEGMKTLPSMERNDLQRILESKRSITQEEYKNHKLRKENLKLHKANVKQFSVEPQVDECHNMLHEASIHATDNVGEFTGLDIDFAYLSNEPVALAPEDQVFGDYSFVDTQSLEKLLESSLKIDAADTNHLGNKAQEYWLGASEELKGHKSANVHYTTSDSTGLHTPDAAARGDINFERLRPSIRTEKPLAHQTAPDAYRLNNPFRVELDSGKLDQQPRPVLDPLKLSRSTVATQLTTLSASPRKNMAPIKIGSPVKLVKQGDRVSVIVQKSPQRLERLTTSDARTALKGLPDQMITPYQYSHKNNGDSKRDSFKPLEVSNSAVNDNVPGTSEPAAMDRGRLFFRIMGLKNLTLPEIEKQNAQISFSLDNGVHCIKTLNYPLKNSNAVIEKEFELTVGETLEFIVTLKCQWQKPRATYREVTTSRRVKSRSRIGRLFKSEHMVTTTEVVPYTPSDPWATKFANDGSFGRCYIDLAQYEKAVHGKVCTFEVPCFNEWERGLGNKLLKTPPQIGLLEVKMLYIPRTDTLERLPSSIRNANETLDRLRLTLSDSCEGYLYQEGGDCPTWKRRFFKLEGLSLIAHLEYSHKTRAKINMCKVVDVHYRRKEQPKGPKRRDFSDGMLINNSFKIRFADGEGIEFGASSSTEMAKWTLRIEEIIERNTLLRQAWVKLMIEAGLQ